MFIINYFEIFKKGPSVQKDRRFQLLVVIRLATFEVGDGGAKWIIPAIMSATVSQYSTTMDPLI